MAITAACWGRDHSDPTGIPPVGLRNWTQTRPRGSQSEEPFPAAAHARRAATKCDELAPSHCTPKGLDRAWYRAKRMDRKGLANRTDVRFGSEGDITKKEAATVGSPNLIFSHPFYMRRDRRKGSYISVGDHI
jgi:hypothetical protein